MGRILRTACLAGALLLGVLGWTGAGARPADTPRLTGRHPCPEAGDFTCATLTVPLDRSGRVHGRLALHVAVRNGAAPLGTLLFLTGGPGQPGVPFAPRFGGGLYGSVFAGWRLVLVDQRGTGTGALRCPALQRQMGSTDLTVPTRAAVTACARAVGPRRRSFSTADTVADLEALRAALGAPKIAIDGVSYGTFVAERYALAHPGRVARLVLDSVVPHAGAEALEVTNAHAVARVLRALCRQERCAGDPAADLAAVVRKLKNGPALLNALVTLSVFDPGYPGVAAALHAARRGNRGPLAKLLEQFGPDSGTPAEALSQGLHASTLCADTPMPWGGPATPLARRAAALRRAGARVRAAAVWPFDRATATGNGLVKTCLYWPPTPAPPPPPARNLPPVPVLLLAGDRDLSTPLEWARREAARAPRGRLVVVPGAGHSVQSRAASQAGRQAVAAFLHSR